MDLRQRGIVPTPETAKQRRDQALNKAFPNAQSREEVEYEASSAASIARMRDSHARSGAIAIRGL
jgi:hypothetical protein